MDFRGQTWMKVFYHNASEKDYFENEEEALSLITEKRFNKLKYVNDDYKVRGKFEFIIDWPRLNEYYIWRQDKNPLFEYESEDSLTASGFEPIKNASTKSSCNWGGLVRAKLKLQGYINSLINGCPGAEYWYFAIGMYKNVIGWHDYGIPTHNDTATDLAEVWVLLPKHYLKFNTCKTKQSYSRRFIF